MVVISLTTPEPEPKVVFGPRTRREIELRVRELEGRLKPNHAELARLREMLRMAKGGRAVQ